LPTATGPSVDVRVLAVAALATLATGVIFGLAPVVRVSRGRVAEGLSATVRAGGGARDRTRSVLVTAEIVASVVLLVATGLLVKALWRVQTIDPGFREDGLLLMRTALPMPKYETVSARERFYAAVLGDVRALPGVSSAAYIGFAPMRGAPNFPVGVNGAEPLDRSLADVASLLFVTPGYFRTLGIPVRDGRDVSASDTQQSAPVAVVSESFARRFFPGQDPIGRHFTFAFGDHAIVGVVGDVRMRGLEVQAEPQVYLPSTQVADNFMVWHAPKDLVVRAGGNAAAIMASIRAAVRRADPQQPISAVRTGGELMADQTETRSVQVRVLAAFAAIAFVLAAVGIHGVLSFAVSQRVQEIGVRVALGARPLDIVSMVAGNAFRLGVVGVAAGVALAYASGRSMQALLAGVQPGDAQTFAAAAGLVAVMLVVGTLAPTLRALRIDPISAIRVD
jgi:putative ABC transport system permease protein